MTIKELNAQDYIELATMAGIMVFLKIEGHDDAAQLVGEQAAETYGGQALNEMLHDHINGTTV